MFFLQTTSRISKSHGEKKPEEEQTNFSEEAALKNYFQSKCIDDWNFLNLLQPETDFASRNSHKI